MKNSDEQRDAQREAEEAYRRYRASTRGGSSADQDAAWEAYLAALTKAHDLALENDSDGNGERQEASG